MAYVDTPRTDAGNATYLDHGKGIDDVSMEISFVSPKKRQGDLVSQTRRKGNASLKTPIARRALLDRPNISKRGGAAEFTPLMKSAKKVMAQKGKENANVLKTPGFLKTLHEAEEGPGLPSESSILIASESDNTDMVLQHAGVSGLPHANSSGIMSTPVVRNAKGDRMLEEQKNLMTLREQENIVNKTEKENFGLKLKIHYLEQMLHKSDPNLNQEAIRENTDLRVDRATLQRELNKVKKQLQNTARDAETLRQQLLDDQAKADQQVADKRVRTELANLRELVGSKEDEVDKLRRQLQSDDKNPEVEELKEKIEDLEADLREKDRIIDSREDDDEARLNDRDRIRNLQQELEDAHEKIEDLQKSSDEYQEAMLSAKQGLANAKEHENRVTRDRNAANEQGGRELEEAQNEFRALREKYDILKEGFRTKSQAIQDLERELSEEKASIQRREAGLPQQIETLQEQQDEPLELKKISDQRLHDTIRQLKAKTEEKDLLQTRHDALTDESEGLQRDLARAQSESASLQRDLDNERQRHLDNARHLKDEYGSLEEKLQSENSRLRTSLETEQGRRRSMEKDWSDKYQKLETSRDTLKQRIAAHEQTIEQLQRSEGKSSSRENKLEVMLMAEKQRHEDEEKSFQQQVQNLEADLQDQRTNVEQYRGEIAALKEDVRLRKRDLIDATQKQEALEDEIVVLQSSLEDDSENTKQEIVKLKNEVQTQRLQLSRDRVEISNLKSELEAANTNKLSLEDDLRTRSARKRESASHVDQLKDLASNLQSEKSALSNQLKEAQRSIRELESQAQAELRDNSFLRHGQDEKDARITQLESEKRALSRSLSQAQEQAKDLQLERELERKDLSYLHHSHKDNHGKLSELELEKSALSKQLRTARDQVVELNLQLQAERENQSLDKHNRSGQQIKLLELETEKRALSESLTTAHERITELGSLLTIERNAAKRKEVHFSELESRPHGVGESKFLNRETSYKIEIARLEEKIADLYGQLRNKQPFSTPVKLPALASVATPNEIADLRSQLEEARRHSREYRDQIQELDKKARKAVSSQDKISHDRDSEVWQLRRDLEKKTHDLEAGYAELNKIRDAVDKSTSKLRTRIQELEKELQQARQSQFEDDSIANERQDLHDMVKSAKLDAEELRMKLSDNQAAVRVAEEREQSLRTTIQRVREERSEQQQCVATLTKQLARLQEQYDSKIEEAHRQIHHAETYQSKDKKTAVEMKGLAKQIEWLKQNLGREKTFRQALAYEKQYYLQQIDMYNACNAVDIQLLKQMGCYTKAPKKTKPRSIRPVANAIIALIRMRNVGAQWAQEKKHHAETVKKVEQARGKRRASGMKR